MQLSSHGSDTDSITKRVFTSRSRRPLSLQSPFLVSALKKEYSIVSHMLVTDTITEATLYENGLYTRHIRLSRPVSDSKYPLPPGSQLIKNMTLRLRLQDQQEETSVTLFQGKMSTDGNNYYIIKGKVSSVLLLLKMLQINHA